MWRLSLYIGVAGALFMQSVGASALQPPAPARIERIASDRSLSPAGPQFALVIGNADYPLRALPNAARDARSVASALRARGFDVALHTNASADEMRDALRAFARRLRDGGTGVFYYAGHGLQAGDATLLTSAHADPRAPASLLRTSVDLSEVLSSLDVARSRGTHVVVLDMCLDQPFAPTSVASTAPPHSLIAYATAPGSLAIERGHHGIFTRAWLDEMRRSPTEPVETMFVKVGQRVRAETRGVQQPWFASSLKPSPGSTRALPATTLAADASAPEHVAHPAMPVTRGILPKDSSEQYELTFWDSIKDSNYASDYEAYLKAYPNGRFAGLAKARIDRLKTSAQGTTPAPGTTAASHGTPPAAAAQAAPIASSAAPSPAKSPAAPPKAPAAATAAATTPAAPAHATAGPESRDCAACPVMIELPAGAFVMGNGTDDPSEKPAHHVTIAAPFAIGKYEVTVEQWNACADVNGCPKLAAESNSVKNAPVRDLSWDDAQAYVKWLSKVTGKPYRLPSEAEWEYADRAGTTGRFWWGDQMRKGMANCKDCGEPYHAEAPEPVGSFAANPNGLFDMNGSVWEWVGDCWHDSYQSAPTDGRVWDVPGCSMRVIRGGSWREGHDYMLTSTRFKYSQSVRQSQDGLRVAKDLKPAQPSQ